MTDKRQKATKVKCNRKESFTKQSIFVEYNISRRSIWVFVGARGQMDTTLYQNRPEDTQNWTNLHLKPHDCRIYYVNINLRHQYGISVAESQTFLRAKRPQRRRAKRNGCFHRLTALFLKIFRNINRRLIKLQLFLFTVVLKASRLWGHVKMLKKYLSNITYA